MTNTSGALSMACVIVATQEMVENCKISTKDLVKVAFGVDENGEANKSHWTLYKELNINDKTAKLGAVDLLSLMKATGDVTPLEAMANELGYILRKKDDITPDKPTWQGEHAQDTRHLGRMSELMESGATPSIVQTQAGRLIQDIEETSIKYGRDYDAGKTHRARN